MAIFKSGDIAYADLPSTKDQQTHEQSGLRPVVIVQDEDAYSTLPTIVIIPFTKQSGTLRFPLTFLVKPSSINGLKMESVLLPFQILTIDRRRLTTKIGILEPKYFALLQKHIKTLMKL